MALLILIGCSQKTQRTGVKLIGNVENLPSGGFIHVEHITPKGPEKMDTINVNANGEFSTYINISAPSFYRLNFNNRQYVTLILNGDEQEVTVHADGNNPRGGSEVSGSYDTEFKNQMDVIMQSYRAKLQVYQQQQMQAKSNGDVRSFHAAGNSIMQLGNQTERNLKKRIWEVTPSLAAYYGLQMIDADKNYTFLDSVATALTAKMPDNVHVQNLVSMVNTKKALAIGSNAPELSLPNPDGEMITLSSLKGKYVLIDFWAAWCRPCRIENPNVVRVYNKYGGDDFEILGVSLDKTKEAWMSAIEQDGLPWLHVSDLKFWNSIATEIYQIRSVPTTYLIDPDGKIMAKNLRGASLEAKLREIFG